MIPWVVHPFGDRSRPVNPLLRGLKGPFCLLLLNSSRCLIIFSDSLTDTLVDKLSRSKLNRRSSGFRCMFVKISMKCLASLINVLLLLMKGVIIGSKNIAKL